MAHLLGIIPILCLEIFHSLHEHFILLPFASIIAVLHLHIVAQINEDIILCEIIATKGETKYADKR